MKVSELMRRNPVKIDQNDTLSLAVQTMLWTRARHLPVLHEGRLVGVLSERDILRYRAGTETGAALRAWVWEAMSHPAYFIHPDDSVTEAAERMVAHKIGCLPVVRSGDLVGILTATDLLKAQVRIAFEPAPGQEGCAGDLMTTTVLTASSDDTILDAIEKMASAGIRHLPVVDGDRKIVGIISDRDVPLRKPEETADDVVSTHRYFREARVSSIMTRDVVTVSPEAPLSLLVSALSDWRLSAVPVVNEDQRLVGIISYVDLIHALAKPL